MKKALSMFKQLGLMSIAAVGIRRSPTPLYQVISREGAFEIRDYPALLVAETVVSGDFRHAGAVGFKRLAGYLFGENTTQKHLANSTPVNYADNEKIAMTAPVLQHSTEQQWHMTFILPANYRLDTVPMPLDSAVTLRAIHAKKVAVHRYSGQLNEKTIAVHSQLLLDWINQAALHPLSSTRSAAYDPPWTLPFLRRNEIHVDIA